MSKHTYLATGLALALFLAPMSGVSAQTADQAVSSYETEMAPLFPTVSAGVYAGSLRFSVNQNGVVQGYYQAQDGAIEPVTGGKNGGTIWLSIGEAGKLRVTANISGNDLVGSAQDYNSSDTLSFTAKPSKQ